MCCTIRSICPWLNCFSALLLRCCYGFVTRIKRVHRNDLPLTHCSRSQFPTNFCRSSRMPQLTFSCFNILGSPHQWNIFYSVVIFSEIMSCVSVYTPKLFTKNTETKNDHLRIRSTEKLNVIENHKDQEVHLSITGKKIKNPMQFLLGFDVDFIKSNLP